MNGTSDESVKCEERKLFRARHELDDYIEKDIKGTEYEGVD
jgi:hypothetical protein